jgi:cytidylate kinase
VSDSQRHIVAVDGLDGSGTSRLADMLSEACAAAGVSSLLLHVGDGKRELDFAGLDEEREAALYYERAHDFDAIERRLGAFEAGIVIVEGVFCLRLPTVAASGALIVLTITASEAQRRIRERDRAKGRSDKEIDRSIDCRYFPGQWRYHAEHNPMSRADVVIDDDDSRQPRVVRRTPGRLPSPIERVLDGMLWS